MTTPETAPAPTPAAELDPLILDMLEWIAKAPRTYDDVMDAWRTSCPRLTVWEDAVDRGFVARRRHHDNSVAVTATPAGLAFLHANDRLPDAARDALRAAAAESRPVIAGYHAHVYFDAETAAGAEALCQRASRTFGILMGRMHHRPVGPHPDWSCQLTIPAARFGDVVPWLALNRAGLNILVHPETGNGLADHRDHAIWLGAVRPLKFDQFMRRAAE